MKMIGFFRKTGFLCILFLLMALNLHAQVFPNLNAQELLDIKSEKPVFREVSGWKNLAVPQNAFFAEALKEEVRKTGFNYLGEVLMLVNAKKVETLLPALEKRLYAVEEYAGILYWSKRQERFYDLFDWVRVESGSRTPKAAKIATNQYMEPFGEYNSIYEWNFGSDRLIFSGINTSSLSYDSVKAVSPGNMVWRLYAYKEGDNWVFYGLGAVKAFDLLGILRPRLSVSFMGRIEAFFKYIYGEPLKRNEE